MHTMHILLTMPTMHAARHPVCHVHTCIPHVPVVNDRLGCKQGKQEQGKQLLLQLQQVCIPTATFTYSTPSMEMVTLSLVIAWEGGKAGCRHAGSPGGTMGAWV